MIKSGPTWTSSHVYGRGLMNPDRGLFYCQIPKCASMWMREYLGEKQKQPGKKWVYCDASTPGVLDMVPMILLRDPVDRWVSACPAVDRIVDMATDPTQVQQIFHDLERWLWDEHSARQWDFVKWLDLSRAVFFYCDDSLSNNVTQFLIEQGFDTHDVPDIVNQQPSEHQAAAQAWRRILSMKPYHKIFQDTFRQDYELIGSVDFYRANTRESQT